MEPILEADFIFFSFRSWHIQNMFEALKQSFFE